MKIGIEAQRIFRNSKHGMELVALELIRQIQQLDKQNEFTLFAKNGPDRMCVSDTNNFHTVLVNGVSYADWEQFFLPKAVRHQKLSLLHCTANTAPAKPSVPLLLTLHDVIFLEQIDFQGSSYQNFGNLYRRAVVPRAIRNAEQILTVSNAEKEIIVNACKVPTEKIEVIYNGVSGRFRKYDDQNVLEEFRRKFGLPPQFILFHGNTAPKKNTQNVITAFIDYSRGVNSLPLVITDFATPVIHQLLKAAGQEGLLSKIFLTGYLPSSEMPLLYNCATAFLYPSLRESFGLPILEAMACGVPVITSKRSAMMEIAGDAALLVDPQLVEEISAAISTITNNDTQRQTLIKKGFAQAAKFSWQNSAIELLKVYKTFA